MVDKNLTAFNFTLEDEDKKLVEIIKGAIKFDKVSGSRYLHPIIAEELAKVFLHGFMCRVENEVRQMQTKDILAFSPTDQDFQQAVFLSEKHAIENAHKDIK